MLNWGRAMLEQSLARKFEFMASLVKQNDWDVSGRNCPDPLCLHNIFTT